MVISKGLEKKNVRKHHVHFWMSRLGNCGLKGTGFADSDVRNGAERSLVVVDDWIKEDIEVLSAVMFQDLFAQKQHEA